MRSETLAICRRNAVGALVASAIGTVYRLTNGDVIWVPKGEAP